MIFKLLCVFPLQRFFLGLLLKIKKLAENKCKMDSPSMCMSSVGLMGNCVSALPLVQVYVMGRSPIALQGRTAGAPILQFTWLTNVTMIGLTRKQKEENALSYDIIFECKH